MSSVRFTYEDPVRPMWSAALELKVKGILDRRSQDDEPWTVKPREAADEDAWELEFTHKGRSAVLRLEREDPDPQSPALSRAITMFLSENWPATQH